MTFNQRAIRKPLEKCEEPRTPSITARVVGIQDGDTVTGLAAGNIQYRILLAGIDAPEHGQAFGTRSKQNLSKLIFGKTVNLDCERPSAASGSGA